MTNDQLDELCFQLEHSADQIDRCGQWPSKSLDACQAAGLFRAFFPEEFGGKGWNEGAILRAFFQLSQSCLTTTFIITQWHAAGRWAREGLFFLVWSCPPNVAHANLCSFAELTESA